MAGSSFITLRMQISADRKLRSPQRARGPAAGVVATAARTRARLAPGALASVGRSAAALAGAVILPAMPGWYHGVQSVADLVDFVVARILDQLRIPHELTKRWGK